MRRVFIPNKSGHDFSPALAFGELVYVTEGLVNRYQVNKIYRLCMEAMKDAGPDDYILLSSLPIISSVMAMILGARFGKVNFLLYSKELDTYETRTIVLSEGALA